MINKRTKDFDILIEPYNNEYFKVDFPGQFNKQMLEAVRNIPGRWHLDEKPDAEGCKTGYFGHSDVSTTMIYTHVLNRGAGGVVSPLDRL